MSSAEYLNMKIEIGQYDITEFVLSGSAQKFLGNPENNQWTLRCRPILKDGRLFDISQIRMMDFVVIRLGRTKPGEKIPLLMRGYVMSVDVEDSVSQDATGTPMRAITISGMDLSFGLIGKVIQPSVPPIEKTLSRTGLTRENFIVVEINKFIQDLKTDVVGLGTFVLKIMKDLYLKDWVGLGLVNNHKFSVRINLPQKNVSFYASTTSVNADGKEVTNYADSATTATTELLNVMTGISLANHQGNLWSYINSYASKPYVEMFIDDTEEESALVVRFTPYRNIKNWTSTQQTNITKTSVVGSSENSYPARIGIGGIKDSSSWFDVSQDPEQIFLSINEIEQIKIRRTVNDVKTHFLTMQGNWGQTGTSGIASPSTVRSEEPAAAAASGGSASGSSSTTPTYTEPLEVRLKKQEEESKKQVVAAFTTNEVLNPWYDFDGIKKFGIRSLTISPSFTAFSSTGASSLTVNEEGRLVSSGPTIGPNFDSIRELFDLLNFWSMQVLVGIEETYSGAIVIRGNPFIKIGQELFINRDPKVEEPVTIVGGRKVKRHFANSEKMEQYYVEHVEHSWSIFPKPQYKTVIGVVRGKYVANTGSDFNEFAMAAKTVAAPSADR